MSSLLTLDEQLNIYHPKSLQLSLRENQFNIQVELMALIGELPLKGLVFQNQKQLEKLKDIQSNPQSFTIRLLIPKIFQDFNGFYKLQFCKNSKMAHFSIQLMTKNNHYLTIKTKQRRILACKQIARSFYENYHDYFKISVSTNTGIIKIHSPQYLTQKQISIEFVQISKKWGVFKSNLERSLQKSKQLINNLLLLASSSGGSGQMIAEKSLTLNTMKKQTKLREYSKMMSVSISMDDTESKTETGELIKNSIKQYQSIIKCQQKVTVHERQHYKNLNLYLNTPQKVWQALKIQDFMLNYYQRAEIKTKIVMPAPLKNKSPYENNSILNYIKIKEPEKMMLKQLNSGGFSTIYLTQLRFWYVYSNSFDELISNVEGERFTDESLLRKRIVIKRENKCDINSGKKQRKMRNLHEKEILKRIKNGYSTFISKYYIPTNYIKCEDDIFMDFIHYDTLRNYVINNSETISLQTKIHLMFVTVQGLRYLKRYKIVHLDLKPSNIMIYASLLVKLIDFGQSYHEKVCGLDFIPGFTVPYGSPETYYCQVNQFSEKNDVFSVGVILHEMLYKKLPFLPCYEKGFDECYKYNNFLSYMYSNPEEMMEHGHPTVLSILNQVIHRCLHPEPECRPELDWIALLLKQGLNYFI